MTKRFRDSVYQTDRQTYMNGWTNAGTGRQIRKGQTSSTNQTNGQNRDGKEKDLKITAGHAGQRVY